MPIIAPRGPVNSENIMASEKICTPEPEKYSMMPCIGSDLAGLDVSDCIAL